jgi:hypothetical protein
VGLEGPRAYLVIEGDLPQILEKPGNLFVVLDMVSEVPQLSFDAFELAGRNSAPNLKGKEQHTVLGHSSTSVLPRHLDLFQNASPA